MGVKHDPATTPTASNAPATTAPATRARPRSAWSTFASSHSQPEKLNDQLRLSGIATRPAMVLPVPVAILPATGWPFTETPVIRPAASVVNAATSSQPEPLLGQ